MVTIDKILGQAKLLDTIDHIIKLGKRGQALLFTGRPGIGKFALACYTAQRFLCLENNTGCGMWPANQKRTPCFISPIR